MKERRNTLRSAATTQSLSPLQPRRPFPDALTGLSTSQPLTQEETAKVNLPSVIPDHKPSRSSEQTLSEPENDWHGVVVSHIKRRWLPCEDDLVNYYPVDHRWSVQGSGSESAKQLMTERVKQFSDAIETEFETDRKELLSLLSTNVPELKIRRKMRMAEMVAASRVSNKGDYRAFEFDHYLTKKLKRSRMERDAKRGAEWYPKK